MKNIVIALLVIGVFVAGIFIGKRLVEVPTIKETTTITRYEPAPYPVEIEVPVDRLVPYAVEVPVEVPVLMQVDSMAIVADYLRKRRYDLDFSADSLGTFVAHIDVERNEITNATATVQPIIKVVETTNTVVLPPRLQGYVILGSDLQFRTMKLSGGIDVRDRYLMGASVIKQQQWGYTIDFGIKF